MTAREPEAACVRYPAIRHELLWYLYELANPDVQRSDWGGRWGMKFVVHFFFDETVLGEAPHSTLGEILKDDIEAALVGRVGRALRQILSAFPPASPDEDYLGHESWQEVVNSSQAAFKIFRPRLIEEGDEIVPPSIG